MDAHHPTLLFAFATQILKLAQTVPLKLGSHLATRLLSIGLSVCPSSTHSRDCSAQASVCCSQPAAAERAPGGGPSALSLDLRRGGLRPQRPGVQ